MDEVAQFNRERWQALADANALFTRPWLDLTPASAQERLDPEGLFGNVAGKKVLCLAGGGGQQSAAFALLGADVTVWDLSEAQLARDQQAAAHYGRTVRTVPGDMRDLSPLAPAAFDLVFQPHSLGFVPDARTVFAQVARVLRPAGTYFFSLSNPFFCGLTDSDWNGDGYTLRLPYVDGAKIAVPDPDWVYAQSAQQPPPVREAHEYRQTLSTLLNGLIALGFVLTHLSDSKDLPSDPNAPPGTWEHRNAFAPAWLAFWLRYQPDQTPRS